MMNAVVKDSIRNHDQSSTFQTPSSGASLMLAFRPIKKKIIILGTRRLAASRILNVLEADAIPILMGDDMDDGEINEEIIWRIKQNQCIFHQFPKIDSEQDWSKILDELDGKDRELFAVCITDTLHAGDEESKESIPMTNTRLSPLSRAKLIVDLCRLRRIPVNVADHPELCDFTFPASHRFMSKKQITKENSLKSTITTDDDSFASSLQIAVTTNGRGCRLATRIRREIVTNLPSNVGDAVERIGEMREMAKGKMERRSRYFSSNGGIRERSLRRKATGFESISSNKNDGDGGVEDVEEEDLSFDTTPINSPVPQISSPSREAKDYLSSPNLTATSTMEDAPTAAAARLAEREAVLMAERKRRMRWVAQMSEYWPITYLGSLTREEMVKALDTYNGKNGNEDEVQQLLERKEEGEGEGERGREKSKLSDGLDLNRRASSQHSLTIPQVTKEKGRIFLVGSGTGHPGLLTAMAYRLLTSNETDLILSDKLVPSSILNLIPKHIELHIARKFPGNAEGAQSELIALALEAAGKQGKCVVRLKQGDPFVYGRGGEEILAFKKAKIKTTIIPGISSALAAPLLLGIPVTQRGSADSMTLCTGVGRGGKSVKLPGYERSRSLVILMGVARLHDVIKTLCNGWTSMIKEELEKEPNSTVAGTRIGLPFPPYTPIAIIERASSTDQRMVASTLEGIEYALTRCGEQRPPGMMVVGWSVMALDGGDEGNVNILDDEEKCGDDGAELERLDRARVQRWLGTKGYLIREGLDQAYTRELALSSTYQVKSEGEEAIKLEKVATDFPLTSSRGQTGWAPPRYGVDGVPRGGWSQGEEKLQETL